MTDQELMQMANRIEALAFEMKAPNAYTPRFVMLANEIRAALRARLAQPEPEPVAWMCPDDPERETAFSWKAGQCVDCGKQRVPVYTAPPQREWQGLTDKEILKFDYAFGANDVLLNFARAIEAKLKEKNNG